MNNFTIFYDSYTIFYKIYTIFVANVIKIHVAE